MRLQLRRLLIADVLISNHAYTRMKERAGIGKKAACRLSSKAYTDGVGEDDVSGRLHKYIVTESTAYNRPGTSVKIYGEMVYCFVEQPKGVLLTVFWVPDNLKSQALGIQRKSKIA